MGGVTHPEGCRCPGCLPGQYVMQPNRPPAARASTSARNRSQSSGGGAGIGILIPLFLAFLFIAWPYCVWHGCKYGGGQDLSGCGAESEWVWNARSWAACGIWWGLLAAGFAAAVIAGGVKPRRVRPPKGRLRVEATVPASGPPMTQMPPAPPFNRPCLHLNAVKVDSVLNRTLVYCCWCPGCETELPASFRLPCCGTEPETPHAYNCPQAVKW